MSTLSTFIILILFWYIIMSVIMGLFNLIFAKPLIKAFENGKAYYNALLELSKRLEPVVKQIPKDTPKEDLEKEPLKTLFFTINLLATRTLFSHKLFIFSDPVKKFYKDFGEPLKVISKLPGWSTDTIGDK